MSAGTVATVGTFDGVHRGHRAVLAEIVLVRRGGAAKPLSEPGRRLADRRLR